MRLLRISIFAIIAMSVSLVAQTDTGHYYIMSFFKNNFPATGDFTGGFFALSTDGINWVELNDGNSPTIPGSPLGEKRVRDPFLYYDAPNNMFRYVYTTGWLDTIIGYSQITIADGKDFKNFQNWDQLDAQGSRQVPIADKIPNASCTWAPEIFRDDLQDKYMIYWSTEIGLQGKRGYYILTSDFKTFTDPVKFFDNGFPEIDGDLLKVADNNYYFFFKDERADSQRIYYVTGTNPQGKDAAGTAGKGWSAVSAKPITALQGCEGPSSIKIGNEYRVYFDPYAARQNYRMIKSTDLMTWKDGGTINQVISGIASGIYYSHCNVIEIPRNIYDWINTTRLSVRWNPKPYTPVRSGGTQFNVPGIYSVLGKRVYTPSSWTGGNAVSNLPAGFFITVDQTKKVGKHLQDTK